MDKNTDSQKKLELATSVLIAYINANKTSSNATDDKDDKKDDTKPSTTAIKPLTQDEILNTLEAVYRKMHELVPHQERKIGLM